MSLSITFDPAARAEFLEAIAWYERQQPGLGRAFALEIKAALNRAQTNPEIFRKVRGRARKIRLNRFKAYSVYFAAKDDAFSVVAVFHAARNPTQLYQRIK